MIVSKQRTEGLAIDAYFLDTQEQRMFLHDCTREELLQLAAYQYRAIENIDRLTKSLSHATGEVMGEDDEL